MRENGFSIAELLVVVAILAIVGLVLVGPPSSVNDEKKLDLAASEVASALRFARSEAMRTGEHHGARFDTTAQRIRVYRLDILASPPVEEFDVYHPVDKKLYDLPVTSGPSTAGVQLSSSDFDFPGNADLESVAFAESGVPVSPIDLALMDAGRVDLALGAFARIVIVAPMTGRVTVQ